LGRYVCGQQGGVRDYPSIFAGDAPAFTGSCHSRDRPLHPRYSKSLTQTNWTSVGCRVCGLWHFPEPAIFGNQTIHRREWITGDLRDACICIAVRLDAAWRKDHDTSCIRPGSGNNWGHCRDRSTFCAIES